MARKDKLEQGGSSGDRKKQVGRFQVLFEGRDEGIY